MMRSNQNKSDGKGPEVFAARICEAGEKHLFISGCALFLCGLLSLSIFSFLEGWHISRDAMGYLEAAEGATGDYFLHLSQEKLFPPLLDMIMIHINHWFGISCKTVGLAFCITCGALCPVIIFSGIWKLFRDYSLAFICGILFLLIPNVRDVSVNILRDAPSLCMNLSGMWAFIHYRQTRRPVAIFEAGLLFTLALGFRFENLEFFLLIPFLNIFLDSTEEHFSFYPVMKKTIPFLAAGTAGIIFGAFTIFVTCLNCNYYTLERLQRIARTYFHVG